MDRDSKLLLIFFSVLRCGDEPFVHMTFEANEAYGVRFVSLPHSKIMQTSPLRKDLSSCSSSTKKQQRSGTFTERLSYLDSSFLKLEEWARKRDCDEVADEGLVGVAVVDDVVAVDENENCVFFVAEEDDVDDEDDA